jgi:chitinase
MDFSAYTHIHLAFAGITSDWNLDVSLIQDQFDAFVRMSGDFKKILSVGGWAFSTDPGTYAIFREAVSVENRETFAHNVAAFVLGYGLDGIDFDWEYPGEPDIPGIPAGTLEDAYNYAGFLESLNPLMPYATTLSVTAPASFWYLKAFPMYIISQYVSYIVIMTYDLHGQWDYGNKWSDPGCPGGNCLRSHVNLTETLQGLSLMTKAGVPALQIVVGVTSYGRSFQMTTPGCYTEECTYTGPSSGAYAGQCTGTPGYISNAEIEAIIAGNATLSTTNGSPVGVSGTPYTYLDTGSYSNILVYDDDQWVAYMDDHNKATRAELYASYGFLGTADWALDLQSFNGDSSEGGNDAIISINPSIWNSGSPTMVCEPPCIFVLPPYPLGFTSTISWPVLTTTLLSSTANGIATVTTTIDVPPFTMTDISFWPVTLQPTDTQTYIINPVQSVTPASFIWTLGPNEATFPPAPITTPGQSVGGPGAAGFNPNPNPGTTTTTTTSLAAVIFPGVTFHTTPVPVTIQPQPTYSITFPSVKTPAVTMSARTPEPTCQGPGCGKRDCGIFGCGGGCGIFGCGGGCGIFGCGGGCGPFGCTGDCPLEKCGGLDCTTPGSCGGSEGDGEENDDCDSPATVSACTYVLSSYTTAPNSYTTTTKVSPSLLMAAPGIY